VSLRLSPDITTTLTDDGLVLLDERSGRYWQLNTTGTIVLQALLAGKTPHHIGQEFATRYRISVERAHHDITALTNHLYAAKLLASS
jgi:Coenzyme PQQ synthesis protein D (PqqD)